MSTERSLVWGGLDSTGYTNQGPYYQDALRTYHATMLNALWIGEKINGIDMASIAKSQPNCSVIPTKHSLYDGMLAPTNPAGTTLRIGTGAALVDRFLYLNDAAIDFDCSTAGYYTLVIRAQEGTVETKTCAAKLIGPSTTTYPNPYWNVLSNPLENNREYFYIDVVIAGVYSNGATLTIIDHRTFFRNLMVSYRQGGGANNWGTNGNDSYVCDNLSIQVGSAEVTVAMAVDYPESYNWLDPDTYGNEPIVFVMPFMSGAPVAANLTAYAGGTGFSWNVSSSTNIDYVLWMALGGVMTRIPPTT